MATPSGRNKRNKHIYNSKAWKDISSLRLAEEPLCRLCSFTKKITPAKHVDHIVPISKGGDPYDYNNTQSLCIACHSIKTREDEGATVNWGCDEHGNPISPRHHWNQ